MLLSNPKFAAADDMSYVGLSAIITDAARRFGRAAAANPLWSGLKGVLPAAANFGLGKSVARQA